MVTCVASTPKRREEVNCMLLTREDFVGMLGDLEYFLDRSYNFRESKSERGGGG